MDTTDRLEPSLPAVPVRITSARPALLEASGFGRTATAEPSRSVNLARAALRAVRRHWWQILLIWVVISGGLLYLIDARVKPMYESDSLLRVEPGYKDLFNTGLHSSEAFGPFMETQVQLILSPNVLSTALEDPKVANQPSLLDARADAESALRRLLRVETVLNTYLLKVSMSSPSSFECATIVNSVVKSYLDAAMLWADAISKNQILSLENYQKQLQNKYETEQDNLLVLAGKGIDLPIPKTEKGDGTHSSPDTGMIPEKNRVSLEQYRRIQDGILQKRIEISKAEKIASMREAEVKGNSEDPEKAQQKIESILRNDPELSRLSAERRKAKDRLDKASDTARNGMDPAVAEAKKKYNKARQDYLAAEQELRGQLLAKMENQGLDESGLRLRVAREDVESLGAELAGLEEMRSKGSRSRTGRKRATRSA